MKPTEVEKAIAASIEKWFEELTPEEVDRRIRRTLDAQFKRIIFAVLGLEESFGNLTFRHTNGHNGPLYRLVVAHIDKVFTPWVIQQLDARMVDWEHAAKHAANQGVEQALRDAVYTARRKAQDQAEKRVEAVIEKALGDPLKFSELVRSLQVVDALKQQDDGG